jgi:MOSC domain-containing protein YiiM
MPTVVSVNVSQARLLKVGERWVKSGIQKRSVDAPGQAHQAVAVGRLGLSGDEQVDLSYHGGLDKAVYAYPTEHYTFWQTQRATHLTQPLFDSHLPWGFVGENLSIAGLLETEVWLGDTLRFADCVLRVTAPRDPCSKFNAVMGYNAASRDMAVQGCSGFYLAVERTGTVAAGEAFEVVPGPRGVSVREAFAAKFAKNSR